MDQEALVAKLDSLAWYYQSRGQSCCAQTAWALIRELRLAKGEKMALTKESSLG
jgi:hypothetical protein